MQANRSELTNQPKGNGDAPRDFGPKSESGSELTNQPKGNGDSKPGCAHFFHQSGPN